MDFFLCIFLTQSKAMPAYHFFGGLPSTGLFDRFLSNLEEPYSEFSCNSRELSYIAMEIIARTWRTYLMHIEIRALLLKLSLTNEFHKLCLSISRMVFSGQREGYTGYNGRIIFIHIHGKRMLFIIFPCMIR